MTQTVLITGANRGLGLALTHACLRQDDTVIACCRDPFHAKSLHQLAEVYPQLQIHQLDVAHGQDYLDLKQSVGQVPIDLIIANAGALGPEEQGFGQTNYHQWSDMFATNTMASLRLAEQFIENLRLGTESTFVCISSVMASMTNNLEGGYYLYRSSKAALNAVAKSLALDLANDHIKVLAMHPGWLKTEMGGEDAPMMPDEAAVYILETLSKLTAERSGEFLRYDGKALPW